MSTYSWNANSSGSWGTPADWTVVSGGGTTFPSTAADMAEFLGTGLDSATILSGATFTISGVTLDDPNATLDILGTLNLGSAGTPQGTLTLSAGTLILDQTGSGSSGASGKLRIATVTDAGGTVVFNGGVLAQVTWIGTLDLSAANAFVKAVLPGTPGAGTEGFAGLKVQQPGGGAGTVLDTGAGAQFGLFDYQTFNSATIDLGSTSSGNRASLFVAESTANTTGAAQVTLGAGVTVQSLGANAFAAIGSNAPADVLVNDGTITAGASGGSLNLKATLTNNSLIQVQNGDKLDIKTNTLTNAASGAITLDGSSTLVISATLQDSGGGITVTAGGALSVLSGGLLTGNGVVSASVSDAGTITAQGGTLDITGSVSGAGSLIVDGNATAQVFGALGAVQATFSAGGTSETLALGTLPSLLTIHEFVSGDTIWLPTLDDSGGLVTTQFSPGTSVLDVLDNGVQVAGFQLAPAYTTTPAFTALVDTRGGTDIVTTAAACYLAGTRIAVPGGERPVEDLAIGDQVLTARGAVRPILWIGRRSYAGRFVRANPHAHPIRIRAGALGKGLPRRDLLVSPRHAMLLDGILIPAGALVDGIRITREQGRDRIDYIHLELETHDVILAEGAASETFVDDDSRALFQNAAEFAALYPDRHPTPALRCAPWADHGYRVEAARG